LLLGPKRWYAVVFLLLQCVFLYEAGALLRLRVELEDVLLAIVRFIPILGLVTLAAAYGPGFLLLLQLECLLVLTYFVKNAVFVHKCTRFLPILIFHHCA